ncbi:MAG: FtsQ-type POTRA domain-containing protein [Gemmatimonadetes bacterium]|nr:FtsQ-type POTRA domain-containing protein [Gemmatimonadota bacterium]
MGIRGLKPRGNRARKSGVRAKEEAPARSRGKNRRARGARSRATSGRAKAGGATSRRALPRPGRRTWIGVGGAVLGALAIWLGHETVERLVAHPRFAVRTVEIEGTARTSPEDLRDLADVHPGDPWLALDADAVELRVTGHPWVAAAHVRRPWPGKVVVQVEECHPIARVQIAGRLYGLCEDLRVVPGADPALPLLSLEGRKIDPDLLSRAVAYTEELQRRGLAEPLEVRVGPATDHIELTARGFEAAIDPVIPPALVARNITSFLEKLDAEGASRGTLRLISDGTAVWKAA